MTTYLTKLEDGKTHHLRTTINGNGVDIVYGIMYCYIEKFWQRLEDSEHVEAFQKRFLQEKLDEGYQHTHFTETIENTLEVYDKAKWHYGGNFSSDLDSFQGFVHTGMFLGWLIEHNLINDGFTEDFIDDIQAFKARELTGPQVFEQCCDGVLTLNDISELGNRFALKYFELDNGQFLNDYETALAKNLPSTYHVADTWENYEILKAILDKRFGDWKTQNKIES